MRRDYCRKKTNVRAPPRTTTANVSSDNKSKTISDKMKAYLLLSALIFMTLSLLLQPGVAAPNAQIQNDSSYVDIVGVYHLLGEVKNTGDM